MASPKSPKSTPSAFSRIACYGTAFLADPPVDAKLLIRGIAADVPQFTSPRLDASFLINCGRFLTDQAATLETPSTYVKRVAGPDFRSPKGTVIYECSTELCMLLAALTPERAGEIASDWYGMHGPPKAQPVKRIGRTQIRSAILKNVAALARQAANHQTKLMLRVDYRKQR